MKNYMLFLISVITVLLPVSAARPMTSLFAESLNASMLQIGWLTACYSITPFLLAIFVGKYVDRFGEKFPLMVGSIGLAIALVLPYLFPNLFIIFVSQLILGGSQLICVISIQNGITHSVPSEKRDKAVSTFSLFTSTGLMLGPLIGGYATEHVGFQSSYLLFSFIAILPFILALFATQRDTRKNESKKKLQKNNMKELLSIPSLKRTIFVSMLILASLDIFYVYYPLYGNSIGLNPSEIGWILMIQSLASIVVRMIMPSLIEKFGKIQVLSTFMFCGAIAYGLLPFFDLFLYIMFVAMILGFGLGIVQPVNLMLTIQLAPNERSAEVLGIRLAGNRLSQVVIPLVFAGISNVTGIGAIFVMEAIILGTGAIFARGIKVHEEKMPD